MVKALEIRGPMREAGGIVREHSFSPNWAEGLPRKAILATGDYEGARYEESRFVILEVAKPEATGLLRAGRYFVEMAPEQFRAWLMRKRARAILQSSLR